MSDAQDFLAQSFAALEQLRQQHLDPKQPAIPAATPQAPAWDPAKWTAFLASPAGKAVLERLRSPEMAWKPLLVVDGQGSQLVAAALKAVGEAAAPPPEQAPRGARQAAAPPPRHPAPLPSVTQVETEQVRYVYTVETTMGSPADLFKTAR